MTTQVARWFCIHMGEARCKVFIPSTLAKRPVTLLRIGQNFNLPLKSLQQLHALKRAKSRLHTKQRTMAYKCSSYLRILRFTVCRRLEIFRLFIIKQRPDARNELSLHKNRARNRIKLRLVLCCAVG